MTFAAMRPEAGEMRKLNEIAGRPFGLWYYRDVRGREVDVILESGGDLSLLECRWEEHPGSREARTLSRVSADLDAAAGPWRRGEHYVLGRPAAASSLTHGVASGGVGDLPAILARRSPLGA